MRLLVVAPHFTPDVAPTGTVAARLVAELVARGHRVDVVTSLPWYREHRVEEGYRGRLVRRQRTAWGSVVRVHPFPTADKRDIPRRAASFALFCLLTAAVAAPGRRVDAVLAVSPPLPIAVSGWVAARARRAPLVLNIQDLFPDVAIELGVLHQPRLIRAAQLLERWCYARCRAVTVLSEDLRTAVAPRVAAGTAVRVIPNFVDTDAIRPLPHDNRYRREHGLGQRTVVMYAGNVGLSQSLEMVIDAAAALRDRTDVVFVVNGAGANRAALQRRAADLPNVCFVDMQPAERLPELLAAADVHLVPLRRGLARASVPSKTYSILAAGRPVLASVDPGSEIASVLASSGAGVAVPPDDGAALLAALLTLLDDPARRQRMGAAARAFVEQWVSPAAVAQSYEELFASLS